MRKGNKEERGAAWTVLGWPDLSPVFPEPRAHTPPPERPAVPPDIGARVETAERRRGRAAKRCILVGCAVWCVGLAVFLAERHTQRTAAPSAVALVLMGVGLALAFPLAAFVTWRLGPTWEQRRQHWRLLHWEQERAAWCERERAHYLAALPPPERARFRQALAEARVAGADSSRVDQ